MHSPRPTSSDNGFDRRAAAGLALGVLVIHIVTNVITPYEFHRDEFLYFAMADHLRLWQMDFPPFIAIIGRISRALFHESVPGLRLAPAFSHAALVGIAAYAASLFGARRSGQMLAALAIATCPFFLRAGSLFQPVTFDQLWWTLALVALALRIRDHDRKHWIGIGVFLGLGSLTKFSVAFLVAGIVVAIVATPLRRDLLTRWPWIAAAIAIMIGHPSITGQLALNWPVFTQIRDLQSSQLSHAGFLDFVTGQFVAGPVLIIALAGVAWMFIGPRAFNADTVAAPPAIAKITATATTDWCSTAATPSTDWRPIAIATSTSFLLLLLMRGKAYYIAPIYPTLAAAGSAALTAVGERTAPRRPTKVLALMAAAVAIYGIATLPFGLPLLAPSEMANYSSVLGSSSATVTNTGERLPLPQDYADMTGWSALTDAVARVWSTLPPADTLNAVVIGTNYGRAGAVDFLGRTRGLPPVISPAGSYWFFGPGGRKGDVAVVIGGEAAGLRKFFRDVHESERVQNAWGVTEEQSVPIYIARGAFKPLAEVWPSLAGQN